MSNGSIRAMKLTQARLKELLHYDPATGIFTWLERPIRNYRHDKMWNDAWAGHPAGTAKDGYRVVSLGYGRFYRLHRLAFLYMTGRFPRHDTDHINGNRADNRWSNLREATRSQNLANGRHKHKLKGARKISSGRWQARLWTDDKSVNLGTFDTKAEACAAYRKAARKHFGPYAKF